MIHGAIRYPTFICVLLTASLIIIGCDGNNDTNNPAGDQQAFTLEYDDPNLEWGPCPEFMPEGCDLAVIQGNPEEPNADALLRFESNTTIERHWHTSAERMILLSGEMEVDYDGQDPVTMEKGTYAYGPAGLAHETNCLDGGDCILFIAFEEPVDAIPTDDEEPPVTGY